MQEFRSPTATAGPFSMASSKQEQVANDQVNARSGWKVAGRVWLWSRHLLTGVGILTIGAFIAGATPIPEMIGNVTGRLASAAISAQTKAQALLQAQIALGQQHARVEPEKELQAWQFGLQGDLATLTSALDGVKTLLVQKSNADLMNRNNLNQINAQLQADRVKQIMGIQAQLEQGNITSAQLLDMVRNFGEALKMDASGLRTQSRSVKAEVMDAVTRVTPLSEGNGSGITDPIQPGGNLDPDIQVALGDIEHRITAIQEHFAIRTFSPRPTPRMQP